ncbi:UNVERIFIED_CONTAM: hypothetical protein HDU68_004782, partial [Siphonaria sp. JEL0065]
HLPLDTVLAVVLSLSMETNLTLSLCASLSLSCRTQSPAIYRRSSNFILGIFASAFAFEVAFENGSQALWDNWNKGVSC